LSGIFSRQSSAAGFIGVAAAIIGVLDVIFELIPMAVISTEALTGMAAIPNPTNPAESEYPIPSIGALDEETLEINCKSGTWDWADEPRTVMQAANTKV
jgi:hypothetical protein